MKDKVLRRGLHNALRATMFLDTIEFLKCLYRNLRGIKVTTFLIKWLYPFQSNQFGQTSLNRVIRMLGQLLVTEVARKLHAFLETLGLLRR
jgi:hypothetical protein